MQFKNVTLAVLTGALLFGCANNDEQGAAMGEGALSSNDKIDSVMTCNVAQRLKSTLAPDYASVRIESGTVALTDYEQEGGEWVRRTRNIRRVTLKWTGKGGTTSRSRYLFPDASACSAFVDTAATFAVRADDTRSEIGEVGPVQLTIDRATKKGFVADNALSSMCSVPVTSEPNVVNYDLSNCVAQKP